MEGRLVLKDCALLHPDGRVRGAMAVVVAEGRVARVAPDAEVPVLPGDWGVACRGRLVAPGLVDCHAHGVGGALAPPTGEALLRAPHARALRAAALEALLTPGEVEALAAAAAARALLDGVTLRLEHLGCPADVEGGLAAAARAAARLGQRTVLAHATHALPGAAGVAAPQAQLEANAAFVAAWRGHPLVRGALGFHASATCDDALLRALGRLREASGAPALYHLAESEEDVAATFARTGRRVVARLEAFGLLGDGCVAAHACGVDAAEAARLAATRTFVALSPAADALRGARAAPALEALLGSGGLLGLGSAGGSGLWRELDAALEALVRLARVGRPLDPEGAAAQLLVDGPAELCSMVYGAPSGAVEEGRLADLVVLDDVPAGPRLAAPLAVRARARVAWTVVAGRVVVREGELLGADALALYADAARAREAVWARGGGPA